MSTNGIEVTISGSFLETFTASRIESVANGSIGDTPLNCTSTSSYTRTSSTYTSTLLSTTCPSSTTQMVVTYTITGNTKTESYTDDDGDAITSTYTKQ
jgi:hypothetical protein